MLRATITRPYLGKVVDLVRRARRGKRDLPPLKVLRQVCDLLSAVGVAYDNSEYSLALRDAVSKAALDHQKLANQYTALANAEEPLNQRLLHGKAISEIEAQLRGNWPGRLRNGRIDLKLLLETPDDVSATERQHIRSAARQLRRYHLSLIRPGAPIKTAHFTILIELADIYASAIGYPYSRFHLPHAVQSRFIRFASLVMQPFFPETEATTDALAMHWRRIKRDHAPRDVSPAGEADT